MRHRHNFNSQSLASLTVEFECFENSRFVSINTNSIMSLAGILDEMCERNIIVSWRIFVWLSVIGFIEFFKLIMRENKLAKSNSYNILHYLIIHCVLLQEQVLMKCSERRWTLNQPMASIGITKAAASSVGCHTAITGQCSGRTIYFAMKHTSMWCLQCWVSSAHPYKCIRYESDTMSTWCLNITQLRS